MKAVRAAIVMFALGILLVNTGDCVNFFFAEAKAAECCLIENCPMSSASQMDACCKTPVSQTAKYVQGSARTSIGQPTAAIIDFTAQNSWVSNLQQVSHLSSDRQDHAPPGGNPSQSLPLLI